MPEPITWLPDGTPYSPRFQDRYRSENGGLEQARGVFLHGCGLPQAWAGAAQWRILETGFGLGLNFLVAWAAWRADLPSQRPQRLHFVSVEAYPVAADDLLRAAQRRGLLLERRIKRGGVQRGGAAQRQLEREFALLRNAFLAADQPGGLQAHVHRLVQHAGLVFGRDD